MCRRPPPSTLFPTRRSSDLAPRRRRRRSSGGRATNKAANAGAIVLAEYCEAIDAKLESLATREASSEGDRKSTRLNSSHEWISYAVFCLKKKKKNETTQNAH